MTSAVDIEWLLQWAFAQTAYVTYRNASPRALAFNHAYTAIPKGCHSLYEGGDTALMLLPASAEDAKRIIAACDDLDEWSRAIVTRCAKNQNRPDCFLGVEAREVKVKVSWRKRRKKADRKRAHRSTSVTRWEPCHPAAICAARDIYQRWHTMLGRLAVQLSAELTDWSISGFSAPERPWDMPGKNIA